MAGEAAELETELEVNDGNDVDSALDEALNALDADPEEKSEESRERNEDGTFKAAEEEKGEEKEEGTEKSGAPENETAEEIAAREAKEAEEAEAAKEKEAKEPELIDGKDISKPPTSWKPDAAAKFGELPAEIRAEIHRREEDIHKGIEQYRGAAQFGSELAKQFQPFNDMLVQHKITPSNLVNAALQFESAMRTGTQEQKIQLLQNLAKSYGLIEEVDADGKPVQADPKYQAIETELHGLKQQMTEAEQRRQQEAVRQEWESFKADPKYSLHSLVSGEMYQLLSNKQADSLEQAYYQSVLTSDQALKALESDMEFIGQVKGDVLQILKSGLASDLKSAYDKAIWINPVSKAKLIAQQQEAERKEAAEKAAAAKKANLANVTSRATPQGKTSGKGTTDDALNAALDAVMS